MLVSQFLTNLKRRGQYQAAQTVLSDADYIAFANDQMRMVICPKILSLRDNFFSGQIDYTLTSSRRYRLPPRILGGRIYQIIIINGSQQYNLIQVPNTDKSTSFRNGFYVTQGDIVLTGDVPTGVMRVIYPIRPPKMSATAAAIAQILTVTSTAVQCFPVVQASQVIRVGSPYRTITPNYYGGLSKDLDCSTDNNRFAVNDIVITQDSTHIVPLQEQLCDWLLQRTHMRVLQALGQTDELQAAGSKLADIERDCMALMSPRVADAPKTVYGGQLAGWNWRE